MRERRARSLTTVGTAVVLAAVLVACTGPLGLGGGGDEPGETSAGGGSTAERPTEIPSWLLECGAATPGTSDKDAAPGAALQLTDADLTAASWSAPDGWEEVTGYVEDRPVEELVDHWVASPADGSLTGLNLATVTTYRGVDWGDLADTCGRVPLAAVEEQLAGYREEIGAEPQSEVAPATVGGLPAVTQTVSLSNYSYVGYWLFSQSELLHVYCQWTDVGFRQVLEDGCADIVASVQVPGA